MFDLLKKVILHWRLHMISREKVLNRQTASNWIKSVTGIFFQIPNHDVPLFG